jgi:predicted SAM-dependent methyltransferase
MKLNIGCGRTYRKGFINIDAYDDTVADELQTATDLTFPDNSAERIEASQVIEHLGFVESNYALAEWFRVLKPDGVLLIDTPDVETSFGAFLRGDDQDKRDLLIWIFGIGTPGMKHRLCYPHRLLAGLLQRTGFANIRHTSFASEKNRSTLRILCKKPKAHLSFQLMASYRKQLNKNRIIQISDETEALDFENIMDFLISRIGKHSDPSTIEMKDLVELVAEITVFNPKAALCFAQLFKKTCNLHADLSKLAELHLPSILFNLLKSIQPTPGGQKQTFQIVHDMGKEAVRRLILLKEQSVLDSLSKTASRIVGGSQETNTLSFSEGAAKRLSDKLFSQGVKEFALGKYDEAREKFANSALLFRDNILTYVNLARVMRILGDHNEAEKVFENASRLLTVFNFGRNSEIRKAIEKEQRSERLVSEPSVSINDLK